MGKWFKIALAALAVAPEIVSAVKQVAAAGKKSPPSQTGGPVAGSAGPTQA